MKVSTKQASQWQDEMKWIEELAPTSLTLSLHFGSRFRVNVKEKDENTMLFLKF